ncbi:hypothetical protein PINS_up018742 [Pythium insidiosum]|nr:hypothetical protein PINS_up018742 [Pythium insidiosum]
MLLRRVVALHPLSFSAAAHSRTRVLRNNRLPVPLFIRSKMTRPRAAQRGRMEDALDARRVPDPASQGHGARRHRQVQQALRGRHVRLCGLQGAAVHVQDQV